MVTLNQSFNQNLKVVHDIPMFIDLVKLIVPLKWILVLYFVFRLVMIRRHFMGV
jgi:hypothetical protein